MKVLAVTLLLLVAACDPGPEYPVANDGAPVEQPVRPCRPSAGQPCPPLP